MRRHLANLPDKDLAYLEEGSEHFADYVEAVEWAQRFAFENRRLMMEPSSAPWRRRRASRRSAREDEAVNCHHNYVAREQHYGKDVFVTRKGAVRARRRRPRHHSRQHGRASYIVRGKGNPESFHSCSHGAGRAMSRNEARKRFTLERARRRDGGRRVPQRRRRPRRNSRRLQADRRRHARAGGSRRDRPHAAPDRLREGVKFKNLTRMARMQVGLRGFFGSKPCHPVSLCEIRVGL